MSTSALPIYLPDLPPAELDIVRTLVDTWKRKLPRNLLRSVYYDGKAPLKDLGISLPPQMRDLEAVFGWPEKAVRGLAQRNVFDSFVAPGAEQDPFELTSILDANRFDLELPQAITSTYKHSCAFLTIAKGDPPAGEPEVVIMARSAEYSSALWDKRRRCVSAVLAVTDTARNGDLTGFTVYLPDVVLSCSRVVGGTWRTERLPNPLGEVLVEPLAYDPQLDRPFGRSRITRAVMSITDGAIRTAARTELGAEFYASPQRALLGGDEDAFSDAGRWSAILGRVQAIGLNEEGQKPDYIQFPQMSMQPHTDMLRMFAARFAGETGLPLSSLGIVQDNPASAEAIFAAKEDLIVEARAANRVFGGAIERVAQKAVMLRDGKKDPSDELRRIAARWANPAYPSPVSAAAALVQLASVFPWIGESEVALEMAGFSGPEITRLLADKRRSQGRAGVEALIRAGEGSDGDAG